MLWMPSQLAIYQQMSALSAEMVEAARQGDWDRLIRLEKSVAALRDALIAQDAADPKGGALATEQEQKALLIQRILEDDAEIRRHTEPWMEKVRQFLGGNAKRRQVELAYGAGSPPGGGLGT
ncbi:MAG TPA: flagellar protein FliT [Rhodocyclaceae bacterium]|nr:flagellar protein FliT [Rhodocyclaceae bacterium]